MGVTVFFSWQSDRPKREGRNFVHKCLEDAIKNLSAEVEFQEAVRQEVEVDSDTRNVPGSPRIFQTILGKIEKASLFVPDLTFVASRPNGHPVPNPNVLIEYGYALKSLGEYRIMPVMNVAYGAPDRNNMPFDLIEHRNPIFYELTEEADEVTRKSQRTQLTGRLTIALKTFFESAYYQDSLGSPAPVEYRKPKEGRARFRAKGEPLGVRSNVSARFSGAQSERLFLSEGPSMWLRVGPQFPTADAKKIREIEKHSPKLALLPFYEPSGNICELRGPDGFGFFYYPDEGGLTPSVVYAFTDGEIWSVNTLYLALKPDMILFEEEKITRSLYQCVDFLKGLEIVGPYRWVAGLEGVRDRHLRADNFGFRSGLCQVDVIEREGFFRANGDLGRVLEPFFEKIFDACGLDRPVRSAS